MKKSEIMQIIKEEVEVVLTNEEAIEMFDLDPAALLDEMMDEGLPVPQFKKDLQNIEDERCRRAAREKASAPAGASATGAQCPEDNPLADLEEKKNKKKKKKKSDDDDWIDDAVNPEHKGYCTPMTKKTCTAPRKRLAKIFKGTIRKSNLKKGKNPHGPG